MSEGGDGRGVQWPAVLQYLGDDELTLFNDAAQWRQQMTAHRGAFAPGDRLIDRTGEIYQPSLAADGQVQLQASGRQIPLAEFTTLLRAHAVIAGSCCAGKVGCNAVDEGIALIASLEDEA